VFSTFADLQVVSRPALGMDEAEDDEEGEDDGDLAEEGEDDDDGDDGEDDDDDDDDDADHAGLMSLIEGLGSGGRGAKPNRPSPQQHLPESDFTTRAPEGLTLDAMLTSLRGTKGFAALQKKVRRFRPWWGDRLVVSRGGTMSLGRIVWGDKA
jgi:hypothetical protein